MGLAHLVFNFIYYLFFFFLYRIAVTDSTHALNPCTAQSLSRTFFTANSTIQNKHFSPAYLSASHSNTGLAWRRSPRRHTHALNPCTAQTLSHFLLLFKTNISAHFDLSAYLSATPPWHGAARLGSTLMHLTLALPKLTLFSNKHKVIGLSLSLSLPLCIHTLLQQ